MPLQPGFRRFAFLSLLLVTLSFGWWPFNFVPRNDVRWDQDAQALRFNERYESGEEPSRGIAVSADDLNTREWRALSIVVDLRGRPRGGGLGTFLEFFEDGERDLPALQLAQWQDHLAIRSRRSVGEDHRGYSEIGYRDCFASDDFVRLLLVSDTTRTSVFVDGAMVESRTDFPLLGADNRFVGKLVFGNSADGTNPFTGEIRKVAIYDRKLRPDELASGTVAASMDFDFEGNVVGESGIWRVDVPERFGAIDPIFLNPVNLERADTFYFQMDVLVNALGFIPVGLCFASIARRRLRSALSVFVAVAFCSFGLSLIIELGQGYLVHRDSSQLDLLLNTASGLLALLVPKRWVLFL